jgi:hypothetical protein
MKAPFQLRDFIAFFSSSSLALQPFVCLGLLDDFISIIIGFLTILLFYGDVVVSPMPQPPIWRTRVSLFVWVITLVLSGMGDPASSYATADIALRII